MYILCEKKNTLSYFDFFVLLIVLFLFLVALAIYSFDAESNCLYVFGIVTNILWISFYRKNPPIFIMFTFFFLYSYVPKYFFLDGIYISAWDAYQTARELNQVVFLNLTFLSSLGYGLIKVKHSEPIDVSFFIFHSHLVFFIFLCGMLICLMFGIKGESILVAGYGQNEMAKTTLHEYFISSLIVALFFMPKKEIYSYFVVFLSVFFVIKTFLYGGRIEVIQCLLVLGYFFYRFLNDFKQSHVIYAVLGGVFVMNMAGSLRGYLHAINITADGGGIMQTFLSVDSIKLQGYVSNNQGDVIQASARIIGMVNDGIIDFSFRIISFFSYLFNLFLSFSEYKHLQDLSRYKADLIGSGGGGLISAYFYVWLGYIGVVIAGFIVAKFVSLVYTTNNQFSYIYGFSVLVMFPRWFAYGPITFIKFCFITMLVAIFSKKIILFFSR